MRHNLRKRGINAGDSGHLFHRTAARDTFDPDALGEQSEEYYQRGRRRRILPSMGMLPGIVGLMAANYVVQQFVRSGCVACWRFRSYADIPDFCLDYGFVKVRNAVGRLFPRCS